MFKDCWAAIFSKESGQDGVDDPARRHLSQPFRKLRAKILLRKSSPRSWFFNATLHATRRAIFSSQSVPSVAPASSVSAVAAPSSTPSASATTPSAGTFSAALSASASTESGVAFAALAPVSARLTRSSLPSIPLVGTLFADTVTSSFSLRVVSMETCSSRAGAPARSSRLARLALSAAVPTASSAEDWSSEDAASLSNGNLSGPKIASVFPHLGRAELAKKQSAR
mmetsp:Transcript_43780/g.107727  ORF Transcript_43780/g.107727 Transcript_43780/m.107727 type:complete len:226 (-) Transcript_43780:57-734(-)